MPLSFVIGVRWGLEGLSIAWVIGYSTWFTYMLTVVSPVVGIKVRSFFTTILRPAVAAVGMYVSIIGLRYLLASRGIGEALTLIGLILVGALVYVGSMLLIGRSNLTEIWDLRRT